MRTPFCTQPSSSDTLAPISDDLPTALGPKIHNATGLSELGANVFSWNPPHMLDFSLKF